MFLKMRRYSRRPKREPRYVSGDNASTQKIAPPNTHRNTYTLSPLSERRDESLCLCSDTHLFNSIYEDWHTCDILPALDLSLLSTYVVLFAAGAKKKKRKVGRTSKKVNSRTRARGSFCQTQAFYCFLFVLSRHNLNLSLPFLHNLAQPLRKSQTSLGTLK